MTGRHLKPQRSQDSPAVARPFRVLVADDVKDAADTLVMLLRHEGYEVEAAYDGAEVLQAARRFNPDVVILDIGMPHLNGYDVARALRARSGDVVLIAVTGWKQSTDKIFARIAGFDHHFGKPCDPRAIVELLSRLEKGQSLNSGSGS